MFRKFNKLSTIALPGLLCFCLVWGAEPARGESNDTDFDYDIFLTSDTLAIWLDITPVLVQSKMEDLLAGLDIYVAVDIKVQQPRKLFFPETLASARAILLISHPLTEDIYRLQMVNFGDSKREFQSQLELSDFLSDSLIFRVAPLSQIMDKPKIRLDLTLVSKSHSANILGNTPGRPEGELQRDTNPEEFFESLFTFFLNLVGFGKDSYHIVTPLFDSSQLGSF
jgi:hypothetical protein